MFQERLGHQCKFGHVVLSAGSPEEEHERIIKAITKTSGTVVLLDERGTQRTSAQFAAWIGKHRDRGEALTFVLGGAYGFSDAIRSSVKEKMALSSMTFPHELCQLMFLEQLYRAMSILAGSGYHH